MTAALPDPDWYLDHVVLPAAGDGPSSTHQFNQESWRRLTELVRVESPTVAATALRQGFVVTREQARRCGVTDAEVRLRVRRGGWHRPRYAVLAVVPDAAERRAALAATASALVRPGLVVSHASAAVLHGLPLLANPRAPELTGPQPACSCARDSVRVRTAALDAAAVARWFGAPVTSAARTVVDLARVDRAAGLVAADSALHDRLVTPAELRAALEFLAARPGIRTARTAIELARPLAESPLESLTRLLVVDAGLSEPELQVWIDAAGRRYRVDMLWRRRRVVLEADGRIKYTGRELWDEKRRQERLERAGYRVVRVLWEDVVRHRAETVARIRAALRLS